MKLPKILRVLVYTDKEGIPGWWWTLFICATDVAIARGVCFKKQGNVDINTALKWSSARWQKKTSGKTFFLSNIARAYVLWHWSTPTHEKYLGHSSMRKRKPNDMDPHFRTSVTLSRSYYYCCRFATLSWERLRFHRRGVHFSIRCDARVVVIY